MIEVQTARTLTQIEVYMDLPASTTVTWLVYEGLPAPLLSLVFSAETTASGSGFQSSGSVSYRLEAGKFYWLGVSVAEPYSTYDSQLDEPSLLSFAVAQGSFTSLQPPLPPVLSDSLYEFRLTTSP